MPSNAQSTMIVVVNDGGFMYWLAFIIQLLSAILALLEAIKGD